MVLKDNCIEIMRSRFPEFYQSESWRKHLEFWDGEETSLCTKMFAFTGFVKSSLNAENSSINFNDVF